MAPTMIKNAKRACRNYGPLWKYGFNFRSAWAYRAERPRLGGEAERMLRELTRDGIAIGSIEALFEDAALYEELRRTVEEMETARREEIENARRAGAADQTTGEKAFLINLLSERPRLDPESIWARFALQAPLLPIANAYFGMYSQLRYYNIWHTFTTQAEARQSQLWHRDREDLQILKVFVHLSDVTDGAGPFTYAPGTHALGSVRREPESHNENGVRRSNDAQMAAVVPAEKWIVGRGPKGTIILADTHGYHKGGFAREVDRLVYTCMFTSPASQARDLFDRTQSARLPRDTARAIALAPPSVVPSVARNTGA